ncbi:Uncharacterised protein [Klebsiella pneumoniae]|nr:hypothetical protein SM60_02462 [Klebsiella pneumoniae]CAB1215925.1 hypothetical protein SFB23_1689 [Klebsiella pneumoniae]SSM94331.1 Uncharacterised protein [Klebsiella pneumoniae]SXW64163.1 Uncharacterised protein [Klebsiella pneumoniae]VGD06362.1 Uncharacterised protein [Klebsiella pneumoniae]
MICENDSLVHCIPFIWLMVMQMLSLTFNI